MPKPAKSFSDNKQTQHNEQQQLKQKEKQKCQIWPKVVKAMPIRAAQFRLSSGDTVPVEYRLADTNERQQHGFQFTCADTIASTQMLFVFKHSTLPSFHMRNVFAPLDIAFIDETGKITDIYLMMTYKVLNSFERTYSPSRPIKFALEARAGFFHDHGIKVNDHLTVINKKI